MIRDPIEDTNTLLLGSEGPASDDRLAAAVGSLPEDLRVVAAEESQNIGPRLEGGEVYTDDVAPVEWLIDRSILGYAND